MAALEYRVLSELLREQSLVPALQASLRPDYFRDPEARDIFKFMYQHWFRPATARTLPALTAIRRKWPSFNMTGKSVEDVDALKALIEELKMLALSSDVRAMASHFQELAEEDPENALEVMKGAVDEISFKMSGGRHMGISGIAETAKLHYEGAKSGSVYGIPWPWKVLTEDTLGKRPGNFIVFYGRMKSMKTWALLFCAAMDYLLHNQRVLVWSREMGEEETAIRMASLLAKVDYQVAKKGQLPPHLENRYFEALDDLASLQRNADDLTHGEGTEGTRDLIILAGQHAPKSIQELEGAIAQYRPTVVYVDSFYHLTTAQNVGRQRWAQIAALAEGLKRMAQDNAIPVVAAAQANRLGDKTMGSNLSEVADSDVIAREADLIIRVIKRKGKELYEDDYEVAYEQMKQKTIKKSVFKPKIKVPAKAKTDSHVPKKAMVDRGEPGETARMGAELALIMAGSRDGVLDAFTIHAVPGYNFDTIQTKFSSDEVKKWVEADDQADDGGEIMKKKGDGKKKDDKPKWSPKTFKKGAATMDKTRSR